VVIKHEISLFCVFAHKNGGNREIDGKAKTLAKGTTRCLNNGWSQPFHSVISPLYMSIELFYVLRNGKDCINFLDKIPFLSRGLQLSQVKKKMMLQTFLFETLVWTSVFLLFFSYFNTNHLILKSNRLKTQSMFFDFQIKSFDFHVFRWVLLLLIDHGVGPSSVNANSFQEQHKWKSSGLCFCKDLSSLIFRCWCPHCRYVLALMNTAHGVRIRRRTAQSLLSY